jgi:cellulose synthase/poly-beta-1,6-N-acetylglucosamine synthase-like glycosyltransferase
MRVWLLDYAVFAVYSVLIVYALYLLILLISHRQALRTLRPAYVSKYRDLSGSEYIPPISILVPCYNEELTILESVRSLLSLNYPEYEVIVINDGSKDKTLRVLIEAFGLIPMPYEAQNRELEARPVKGIYHNPFYPNFFVMDKDNGGKEDALNAGINMSRYALVSTVDADSLLESDALLRLVRVYMENPEETVAIGGNVRVANGCVIENGQVTEVRLPNKLLPLFQHIEYLRSFLGGRIGWSAINGLLIVSGAFGLFRKDTLIQVGGYGGGFPGEDMNIILKLHKRMLESGRPYRIAFCPDAVCWTQVPDTLPVLGSQRKRWSRGNLKNVWMFRGMMFIPRYGTVGLLSLPYAFFYEMLSPYLRLTGYLALLGYVLTDMTSWRVLVLFFLADMLIGMLFSCGALWIEEMAFRRYPKLKDLLKMLGFSVLMVLGYDQLNVWWKLAGHLDALRKHNSWGVMVRKSWQEDVAGKQAVTNQSL